MVGMQNFSLVIGFKLILSEMRPRYPCLPTVVVEVEMMVVLHFSNLLE